MTETKAPRKRRVDRVHIIYRLVVGGLDYIGVTARTESTALKSVRVRANKHYYRATAENRTWLLCEALRLIEDKSEIEITVLEAVRGKPAAHRREVELRRAYGPALNSDTRGD